MNTSVVRRVSSLIWLPPVLLATVLERPAPHPLATAALATVGAAAWLVVGLRLRGPRWLEPVAITALAAAGVGCFLAAGRPSTAAIAFSCAAVLTAGSRLPATAAVAVLAATAGGTVALSHLAWGTNLALYLVALTAVLLGGLSRREQARRADQRERDLVAAARFQEEHARAAALAERTRIARDVHDVLAHSLSALAVQLQGARLMLLRDGAPPDTLAQVERAQHLATEGLAEARRAVAALRTEPVDLAAGLRALVETAPGATLEIDGTPPDLAPGARETVLRTAQEALTNARKHAAGSPVTVRLSQRGGATELEVHDVAGLPPVRAPGGYGLTGMAERAALVGADLEAGPVEDGWRVRLRIPAP